MRALVLAAGFGTRLGALSDERPKPLLPVCDVPVIRYVLALLEAHGFTEAMVNLHHRGDLLERELGEGTPNLRVHYSRETEILGTGGGIQRAGDWLTRGGRDRFLVVNGKLVIDADLDALLAADAAAAVEGALATMLVREVPDPDRWGAIETDGSRVVRIAGKGSAAAATKKWMFTGVHVLGPELVARLPEGNSHIIDYYVAALARGERIAMHAYDRYFEEHSTPARYLAGNIAVLRGRAGLRHPPADLLGVDATATLGAGAVIIDPVRIGPGAVVGAGAQIGPDAVIGRGARVAEGAQVREAVVWPGAVVESSVARAIVTSRGVFPVEPDAKR